VNMKRTQKIEKAIELVQEAQELIDEALIDYKDHQFVKHYRAYGRYGFNRLLGEGNPYDEGLNDLRIKIREEEGNEPRKSRKRNKKTS